MLVELFPVIPERSRFNRRRALQHAMGDLRRGALTLLDLAQERQAVSDSLPVSVLPFPLVPGSPSTWRAAGASYVKGARKQQTLFGYQLHLLVTLGGAPRLIALAVVAALNLYGELRSISRTIEAVPLLRSLDSLGRVD